MCILVFTNRKLPLVHSETVPRSRSKASTYAEKQNTDKACAGQSRSILFFIVLPGHIDFSNGVDRDHTTHRVRSDLWSTQ